MKHPLRAIFFSFSLSVAGLNVTFAQTESRPSRADQMRQTLSTKPEPPAEPPAKQTSPARTGFALEDGSVVKLKLMRNLLSSEIKDEESVMFEVIEDVKVDDVVVIPRGAQAEGTIIEAQAARRMGRTGRVGVRLDYVFLATGKRAKLRAISARSDGGRGTQMAEHSLIAAQFFFPVAPFFLLQKGKEVTIPKGTLATAFIDGEHPLDRENFSPPPEPRSSDSTGVPKP
jgi:hypothetical protein